MEQLKGLIELCSWQSRRHFIAFARGMDRGTPKGHMVAQYNDLKNNRIHTLQAVIRRRSNAARRDKTSKPSGNSTNP